MDKTKINVIHPQQIIKAEIQQAHFTAKGVGGLRGKQGEQGKQGEPGKNGKDGAPGKAATIAVGNTETLPAGENAYVVNMGDEKDAIFDFGIPQGDKGDKGEKGDTGAGGIAKSVEGNSITITDAIDAKLYKYEIVGERSTTAGTPTVEDVKAISHNTIVYIDNNGTIKNFSKPIDLYGLNKVRDSIERNIAGVWGIMHRTWLYEFTGVEEWQGVKSNDTYIRGHTIVAGASGEGTENNCLSNSLIATTFNDLTKLSRNAIASWRDTKEVDGRVDICLDKSLLPTADNEGIKAWLSQRKDEGNPVVVLYQREPIFEPLPQADQEILEGLVSISGTTKLETQAPQFVSYLVNVSQYLENKQNKLIAGDGIKLEDIENETKISASPQSANLIVTASANPLDPTRYVADYSSDEIRNARNAGKTVVLYFEDTIENTGSQIYQLIKIDKNGAFFSRNRLDGETDTARQIDIKVDYAKNVTFVDTKIKIPSEAQVEKKLNKAYSLNTTNVECELVKVLGCPAGTYAQSMCSDGNYLYAFYTGAGDVLYGRKIDLSDMSIVSEKKLTFTGHGNACSFFDGKIYLTNFTNRREVDVVSPVDFSLIRKIDPLTNVRAFAIGKAGYQLFVAIQRFETNQIRSSLILNDRSLRPIETAFPSLAVGNRNGLKIVSVKGVPYVAFCKGDDGGAGYDFKGNTVEFMKLGDMDTRFTVGLDNSGVELQDISQIGDKGTGFLAINSGGSIYKFNISDAVPATYLADIYNEARNATSKKTVLLSHGGTRGASYELVPVDRFKWCKSFVVQGNVNNLLAEFSIDDGIVTASSKPSNDADYTGDIQIRECRLMQIQGNWRIVNYSITYRPRRVIEDDKFGSYTKYTLTNDGSTRVRIYSLTNNKIEVDLSGIDAIVAGLKNPYSLFIGDVFPTYIEDRGFVVPNANMITDWAD